MKFAEKTDVPVERSKAEIESIVARYDATGYMSGWLDNQAMITFEMSGRRVRFNLPLPDRSAPEFTHRKVNQHASTTTPRDPADARAVWEQACRQKWRALLLIVKAKLEAVESKITTFDEEFMPHIVMADGRTIGEAMIPRLDRTIGAGKLPPLLPAASSEQE